MGPGRPAFGLDRNSRESRQIVGPHAMALYINDHSLVLLGQLRQKAPKPTPEMEGIDGHSAACCNIPPVISKDYARKEKYETVAGLKKCYKLLSHFHDRFPDA